MRLILILPIAFLISACTQVEREFCSVVPGVKSFDADTAALMVKTDRTDVEQIRVENAYWEANCD